MKCLLCKREMCMALPLHIQLKGKFHQCASAFHEARSASFQVAYEVVQHFKHEVHFIEKIRKHERKIRENYQYEKAAVG